MLLAAGDKRSLMKPGIIFYGWQFSTKPGWHVLSGCSIDVPDTATRAGPHNGNAGRVGVLPHGSEVGEGLPERTTRMHTPCREITGQNADRAGSFGDSFVDLNVKASRRRNGAEQAGPPMRGISRVVGARPGEEIARKDGQRRERSAYLKRIESGCRSS